MRIKLGKYKSQKSGCGGPGFYSRHPDGKIRRTTSSCSPYVVSSRPALIMWDLDSKQSKTKKTKKKKKKVKEKSTYQIWGKSGLGNQVTRLYCFKRWEYYFLRRLGAGETWSRVHTALVKDQLSSQHPHWAAHIHLQLQFQRTERLLASMGICTHTLKKDCFNSVQDRMQRKGIRKMNLKLSWKVNKLFHLKKKKRWHMFN